MAVLSHSLFHSACSLQVISLCSSKLVQPAWPRLQVSLHTYDWGQLRAEMRERRTVVVKHHQYLQIVSLWRRSCAVVPEGMLLRILEDGQKTKHLSGSWRLAQAEVSCQICAILPLWTWDWTVNVFVYLAEMQRACLCLSRQRVCVFNGISCQYLFLSFIHSFSICHWFSFCFCPNRIIFYLLGYSALFHHVKQGLFVELLKAFALIFKIFLNNLSDNWFKMLT